MCHFIVNSLRAAWIRVGVAIVVAGDRVARALGGNIYFFSKLLLHVITIGSVQRNLAVVQKTSNFGAFYFQPVSPAMTA